MSLFATAPALACLLAAATTARAAEPAAADVASFAQHDQILDARISPGGRTLALVALEGGRRTLGLLDLGSRKLSRLRMEGESAVGSVHWASEDRLVLELVRETGDLAAPQSLGELHGLGADGRGGRLVFGYRAGEMQTGTAIRKAHRRRCVAVNGS